MWLDTPMARPSLTIPVVEAKDATLRESSLEAFEKGGN
jgi:hypothetical protein